MDLNQAHYEFAKEMNLKVGDTVRILRPFKSLEARCGICFNPRMESYVGQEGVIHNLHAVGAIVKFGDAIWTWPWFCLQVVKKAEPVIVVTVDGVQQTLSEDDKDEILDILGL